MITASIITTEVNAILAALTPTQRWDAVRQLDNGTTNVRWLIPLGLVIIIILILLFIIVSYYRRTEQRRISQKRFFEYADKLGLTHHERQILQDIAINAGLRRYVSIFSMIQAFDRGASKIIEDTLALHGTEASKHLSAVLSTLREKLGFEKSHATSVASTKQSGRLSSRQIPIGKQLYLTYTDADDLTNMESTVIKNDDVQLTARLAMPLHRNPGELCYVRYCFGGSVWEYDATVVSCQGDIVVLSHSNNIRFINRRRFLRVPVSKPAFVAHFPFVRTLPLGTNRGEGEGSDLTDVDKQKWKSLDFVPAVVTELAGPGLRIETPLQMKTNERVLIIFKLNEESQSDSSTSHNEKSLESNTEQKDRKTSLQIVEDIAEIRHTEAIQNGFSTGLELTGLSDSDVNVMIRATNAASMKIKAQTHDGQASVTEDGQIPPEPVLVKEM